MSEKKSKSKSKSKDKEPAEKPPKDKPKKDKDDTKSKKSEKGSKVEKPKKKKEEKEKEEQPSNKDLDLSQDNFSDFLKNPFSYPPTLASDDAYVNPQSVSAHIISNRRLSSARSVSRRGVRDVWFMVHTTTKCTG
jgi:hypothetical protein